jgi:hypothetical protein
MMNKYTAVYTAHDRYDTPMDGPTSRVEYIQGETLDDAIEGHMKHMKAWAIHDIVGDVVLLEGHVKQIDIGAGIGHTMDTSKDVIITGVNNEQVFD